MTDCISDNMWPRIHEIKDCIELVTINDNWMNMTTEGND